MPKFLLCPWPSISRELGILECFWGVLSGSQIKKVVGQRDLGRTLTIFWWPLFSEDPCGEQEGTSLHPQSGKAKFHQWKQQWAYSAPRWSHAICICVLQLSTLFLWALCNTFSLPFRCFTENLTSGLPGKQNQSSQYVGMKEESENVFYALKTIPNLILVFGNSFFFTAMPR